MTEGYTFTSIVKAIPLVKERRLTLGGMPCRVAEVWNPALRPSRIPFSYEPYDHPAVAALRRALPIEETVAKGRSDLERATLLMNWVWRQAFCPEARRPRLRRAEDPAVARRNRSVYGFPLPLCDLDAQSIFRNSRKGTRTIYCSHAAWAFMQCASAVGLVARKINISGHGVADVWCHDLRTWVLMDPNRSFRYEENGRPLSALDVREAFFRDRGRGIVKVYGLGRKKAAAYDPPDPISQTPAGYEWFNILTRNDYLSSPVNLNDYWDNTRYLVLRDRHNAGQKWINQRVTPPRIHEGHRGKFLFSRNPDDLFWDIGLSEIKLTPSPLRGCVRATVIGHAPNLARREARIDDGPWRPLLGSFQWLDWRLHKGPNALRARAVHKSGFVAPEAGVVLEGLDA